MAKKYNDNEVKDILNGYGYEMIGCSYKNSKVKMTILDIKNRYLGYINLEFILANNGTIRLWHKTNPYSMYNINLFLKNNNIPTYTIDEEYENRNKKLMKWVCSECGDIFECRLAHVIDNKKHLCNKCSREIQDEKRRESPEYLNKIYLDKGLTPMIDRFYAHDSIPCVDKDGYIYYSNSYSVRKDEYVGKIVDAKNPYTITNIRRYIELNNIKCKLISDKYLNSDNLLEFQCECGEIFSTRWDTFCHSEKNMCDICSKSMSKGEYKVSKWLTERNFDFQREYKFDDCKYKRKLPFDVAVFDKNKDIHSLIEIDGIQHEQAIAFFGGEEMFNRQQKVDLIKDKYCLDNNIPLLRINWRDIKNDNYKNILDEFYKTNISYV